MPGSSFRLFVNNHAVGGKDNLKNAGHETILIHGPSESQLKTEPFLCQLARNSIQANPTAGNFGDALARAETGRAEQGETAAGVTTQIIGDCDPSRPGPFCNSGYVQAATIVPHLKDPVSIHLLTANRYAALGSLAT